ncbi:MAG: transcription antitermination factor NusB [Lentisphaerae bacterium]|nr:transcription antitermination factor NusB [Lentisphaerota bacterium]
MNTRRQAREWAVQLLFQLDFNPEALPNVFADFWSGKEPDSKTRQFTEELVRGVREHGAELDAKLRAYADNWDLKRMNAVDRNVMRLALFEMLFRPEIPPVVSINEAVDIAKAFSSMESGRFVNGVLDRACQDLDRPRRAAAPRANDLA